MGNICDSCYDPPVDFDGPVDITHFEIGRVIGKGSFGKVCIVVHKKSKQEFALKYINKAVCSAKGLAKNMIEERKLLEEAKSPFICNLRYAFQDDLHLLMVIDLNVGGDLAFHLKFGGAFPEDRAKFYFAEIVCGLAYLHSLKIVHRDLKPGNVLLSESGHASLSDFNLACHYKEERPLTSRSGTLKYMAPEILSQKGYLNLIDWWSLGVMTFEMLFGYTPYENANEREIKRAIVNDPLKFPETSAVLENASIDARNIIASLLVKDPSQRLGSSETGGDSQIRSNKWFEGWDWKKVMKQEITVPFIPDIKRCTYYNRVLNLDEVLFDENPLQSRPVKKNRSRSTNGSMSSKASIGTSKGTLPSVTESEAENQMRQFDEDFLDYDYTKLNVNTSKPKPSFYAEPVETISIRTQTSFATDTDQKASTTTNDKKLTVVELEGPRKRSVGPPGSDSPTDTMRPRSLITGAERGRKALSLTDAPVVLPSKPASRAPSMFVQTAGEELCTPMYILQAWMVETRIRNK
ncbi:kinase-like domain-containing protein [Obelidium mucronatum]|nr:kinase-like domain-containing protein [Obelidium mucronatum]